MEIFLYLIVSLVYLLLVVEQICMLLRAVMSWITLDEDSPFATFLFYVTEPVIAPVRLLLSRFEAINESPIDIPFLVTALLLSLLIFFMPTVAL